MKIPVLLASLASTLSCGPILANSLPPIVITKSNIAPEPVLLRVIDRAEIQDSGVTNLPDLLRARGGLVVRDFYGDGSGASIDLRGFGPTADSNVLILIDGRPLNNAGDIGALRLGSIDLARVERIEISRGSSGVRHGNQAVGGVIHIHTRRAVAGQAAVHVGTGSYDTYQLDAGIAAPLGRSLLIDLGLRHRRGDNYREHNRVHETDLSLALSRSLANGGSWRVALNREFRHLQLPGALTTAELSVDRRQVGADFVNDYSQSRQYTLDASLEHPLSDEWWLKAFVSLRDEDREFVTSFRGAGPSTTPIPQTRQVWLARVSASGKVGHAKLTVGGEFESTQYLLVSAFGPQGIDQRIVSAWAELSVPLSRRLTMSAGVRHARVDGEVLFRDFTAFPAVDTESSIDDQATVGNLELALRVNRQVRVFLRADQNFRFAKVDEHTNVFFGQPVGLSNQQGISYEAGVRYERDGRELQVLVYQLDLDDEISFDASGFVNINLERTRRRGLMLEAATPLSGHVRVGGAYSYIESEILKGPFSSGQIPLVPKHQGRVFVEADLAHHWQLTGEWLYTGARPLSGDFDNSSAPLPSHRVVNLSVSYRRGPWQVVGRIRNLLDKRYVETGAEGFFVNGFYPAPERNFWMQVRYAPRNLL